MFLLLLNRLWLIRAGGSQDHVALLCEPNDRTVATPDAASLQPDNPPASGVPMETHPEAIAANVTTHAEDPGHDKECAAGQQAAAASSAAAADAPAGPSAAVTNDLASMDWADELPAAPDRELDPWDCSMQPATQDLLILAIPSVSSGSEEGTANERVGLEHNSSGLKLPAQPMDGGSDVGHATMHRAHLQSFNAAARDREQMQQPPCEQSADAADSPLNGQMRHWPSTASNAGHRRPPAVELPIASRFSAQADSTHATECPSTHAHETPATARRLQQAGALPSLDRYQVSRHAHQPMPSQHLPQQQPQRQQQQEDGSLDPAGVPPSAIDRPVEGTDGPQQDAQQQLVASFCSHAQVAGFVWSAIRHLVPQVCYT